LNSDPDIIYENPFNKDLLGKIRILKMHRTGPVVATSARTFQSFNCDKQDPKTTSAVHYLSRITLRGGEASSAILDAGDRNRHKKKRTRKSKETAFSILMSEEKKRRPWKQNIEKVVHASVHKPTKDPEEYAHGHLRPVARINKNEVIKTSDGIISWDEWEQRQREAMRTLKNKQSLSHVHRAGGSRGQVDRSLNASMGAELDEKNQRQLPKRQETIPTVFKVSTLRVSAGLDKGEKDGDQGCNEKGRTLQLTPTMLETMTKRQLLKAAVRSGICASYTKNTFQHTRSTAHPHARRCIDTRSILPQSVVAHIPRSMRVEIACCRLPCTFSVTYCRAHSTAPCPSKRANQSPRPHLSCATMYVFMTHSRQCGRGACSMHRSRCVWSRRILSRSEQLAASGSMCTQMCRRAAHVACSPQQSMSCEGGTASA
jgi:hypothetical protein